MSDDIKVWCEEYPRPDQKIFYNHLDRFNGKEMTRQEAEQLITEHPELLSYEDAGGADLMNYAVLGEHFGLVDLLIERGADINRRSNDKSTILHSAVTIAIGPYYSYKYSYLPVKAVDYVQRFIDLGSDCYAKTMTMDTPFHYATTLGTTNDELAAREWNCVQYRRLLEILVTAMLKGDKGHIYSIREILEMPNKYGYTPLGKSTVNNPVAAEYFKELLSKE